MSEYRAKAGLRVDARLAEFIDKEVLPGLNINVTQFWLGFSKLLRGFRARNQELLVARDEFQTQIDDWHRANGPVSSRPMAYELFLKDIGYIVHEPADFTIETSGLDGEIATLSGPQMVAPLSSPHDLVDAANARWGSLFEALYGTDAITRDGRLAPGPRYNQQRGAAVFSRVAQFLDQAFPLASGSHAEVREYRLGHRNGATGLAMETEAGSVGLAEYKAFAGWAEQESTTRILLRHRGRHAELVVDRSHPLGAQHPAGLADVIIESALTAIADGEDSVAAVDSEDKVALYRNWLGLMAGTIEASPARGSEPGAGRLNADRVYTAPDGGALVLKGRALLLVRTVGPLMSTRMVLDPNGEPMGEGLVDDVVAVLCAMHGRVNGASGAIYVVKPKMHGPAEVAFACEVFGAVEALLGLAPNTVKLGLMDEERRTSANLKACIHAARQRLFLINTGSADRIGDEIHTAMEAGPVLRRGEIEAEGWLGAYEDRNVLIGLRCGLGGRAQIGKGMWARPDAMAAMLESKVAEVRAGANAACVPSPTAATLHALHYHEVDVSERQNRRLTEPVPDLRALFSMPAMGSRRPGKADLQRELDSNAHRILGYVVRWIDQGIGVSRVPDIDNVGLVEERATCRIASQHIANWLRHEVMTQAQVVAAFRRMARIVDEQNAEGPAYRPMSTAAGNSLAFGAALALVLGGTSQPSGYTEPILHAMRLRAKAEGR
jgi:malate synthase